MGVLGAVLAAAEDSLLSACSRNRLLFSSTDSTIPDAQVPFCMHTQDWKLAPLATSVAPVQWTGLLRCARSVHEWVQSNVPMQIQMPRQCSCMQRPKCALYDLM